MTPRLSDRSFNKLLSLVGSYQLKILYTKSRLDFSSSQWKKLLDSECPMTVETIKLSDKEFHTFLPITGASMMLWLATHDKVQLTSAQDEELTQQAWKIQDKSSYLN